MTFYDDEPSRPDPEAERRAAVTNQLGDELLAGRTPRQRELAGRLYEQLRAGSDVDDLKHLIADLSRTATADARRDQSAAGRRTQGGAR